MDYHYHTCPKCGTAVLCTLLRKSEKLSQDSYAILEKEQCRLFCIHADLGVYSSAFYVFKVNEGILVEPSMKLLKTHSEKELEEIYEEVDSVLKGVEDRLLTRDKAGLMSVLDALMSKYDRWHLNKLRKRYQDSCVDKSDKVTT